MTEEDFLHTYAGRLNTQQLQAVCAGEGQTLLLAVPGSGKTATLVARLGYLIHCKGVDPGRILTMTYTVAATQEMSTRFRSIFGSEKLPEIRTINGLAQKIITCCSETDGRPPFTLEDNEGILTGLVRDIYRRYYPGYPADSTIRDIRTAVTYFKNSLLPRSDLGNNRSGIRRFPEIYDEYTAVLRKNRRMDYDDQLLYAYNILQTRPDILQIFQKRFQWIFVDEAQDTSRLQHEIIRKIAGNGANLFMVGDEDQSIYGFRAACPEALLRFRETYPQGTVLLLEDNYRSSAEIVTAANRFVAKNRDRTPKELRANRPSIAPVSLIRVLDRSAQYRYLLTLVDKDPGEIAVLFRNNDSAVPLIDLFERHGIDFRCRRFDDIFFSHRVLADITDIIHFSFHDRDSERFMRIYYKLGCMISRQNAEYACSRSAESGKPILHELIHCPELSISTASLVSSLNEEFCRLPHDSAPQALRRIRFQMGYGGYAEQNQLDLGKLLILDILAEQLPSAQSLLDRLAQLRKLIRDHVDRDARIILSTIHSAKGLEFDRVWMLDVFDGILPQQPGEKVHTSQEIHDYEEDRRLCYVGMTRARDQLSLFVSRNLKSEFTGELTANLPRERFDENCMLSFLETDHCGTIYRHCRYGSGTVIAQCNGMYLVSFPGIEPVLMNINEMIEQRTRCMGTTEPSKQTSDSGSFHVGDNVTHITFGQGTITELMPDLIRIRFHLDNSERTFLKSVLLSGGKIRKA